MQPGKMRLVAIDSSWGPPPLGTRAPEGEEKKLMEKLEEERNRKEGKAHPKKPRKTFGQMMAHFGLLKGPPDEQSII